MPVYDILYAVLRAVFWLGRISCPRSPWVHAVSSHVGSSSCSSCLAFLALSCAVEVPFSADGEPNLKSSKPATALKLLKLKLKQAPDLEQFSGRHGPQLRRLSPASPLPFCFPPPPPGPLLPLSSENIGDAFEVYQELGVLARGVRIGLCKGGEFLFRRGSRFLSFAHLPTQLVRQVLASFLASSSSLQGEVFRAVSRLDVRDLWRRRVRQSKAQSLPFKVLQSSSKFFKVLQSSSKFFKVLQSSSKFFKVLQSSSKFFKVLQSSSKFFKVLQSSSKFFKVLQSSSKFFKLQTWRGFLSVIPSDHAIGTLSLCPN